MFLGEFAVGLSEMLRRRLARGKPFSGIYAHSQAVGVGANSHAASLFGSQAYAGGKHSVVKWNSPRVQSHINPWESSCPAKS